MRFSNIRSTSLRALALALALMLSLAGFALADTANDVAPSAPETQEAAPEEGQTDNLSGDVLDDAPVYETLQKGSRGDGVVALQTKLIELGYLDDVADGAFGSKTETAVKLFQQEQGFEETGVADSQMQEYLLSDAALTRDEVIVKNASPDDQLSVIAAMATNPVTVSSAKVLVQSALNKDQYPDMMTAVIKNNSNSKITKYTIVFLGYNENGEPVKLLTAYSDEGFYEIIGDANDVEVEAGAEFGASYGWRLKAEHGIGNLMACVYSVTYQSGDVWQNPLYEMWKEAFAEKPLAEALRAPLTEE